MIGLDINNSRSCLATVSRSDDGASKGFTLVEVMIAMIVLAVLALGGASFLAYSRMQVDVQRNKRAALEAATGRMEELRAAGFDETKPTSNNYVATYLARAGNAWVRSSSNPGEAVSLNGHTMPMATTVQFVDVDGGSASYDCALFTVEVGYRVGSADRVRVSTFRAP